MLRAQARFNFILLAAVLTAAIVAAGCTSVSPEEKAARKITASIRLYLEGSPGDPERTQMVPIHRKAQIMVCVEKKPFLDERAIQKASVIDVMGGFGLQLEMNTLGNHLLRNITVANRGRRIAVYSEVGTNDVMQSRWLAAPLIGQVITNGVLAFTPDATREETARLARGLENVVTLRKKQNRLFPMPE